MTFLDWITLAVLSVGGGAILVVILLILGFMIELLFAFKCGCDSS